MTIFQIECFLAVAEFLNFAKAAEQMNISQPAITRQIQSLEDELGGKPFPAQHARSETDGKRTYFSWLRLRPWWLPLSALSAVFP